MFVLFGGGLVVFVVVVVFGCGGGCGGCVGCFVFRFFCVGRS